MDPSQAEITRVRPEHFPLVAALVESHAWWGEILSHGFAAIGQHRLDLLGCAWLSSHQALTCLPKTRLHIRLRDPVDLDRLGSALLSHVEASLCRTGGGCIQARVREDQVPLLNLLFREGFTEVHRVWVMHLRLKDARVTVRPVDLRGPGLSEACTLADEQRRDPYWQRKLHSFYCDAAVDLPGPDRIEPLSFRRWCAVYDSWKQSPDLVYIAREGEIFTGITCLHPSLRNAAALYQRMTAVRPAYRRRGIATGLKKRSIESAIRESFEAIYCSVSASNGPMLELNEKLGFMKERVLAVLEKRVPASRGASGRLWPVDLGSEIL